MIFYVLACDYDGTLALHGKMSQETAEALVRVKNSGRKVMMVTGRELPDLRNTCEYLDIFDLIVAENGALLYIPRTREERLLCEPPDERLVAELVKRGVGPISVGKGIIATWEPHENTTLEVIHELGLEHQVIFNKGAVMILPAGVNKGFGLDAGLCELGLSRHNTVGVGDAENDHTFLAHCECGVAVSNALPALKERADVVTERDHGDGVIEFIDNYLLNDCIDLLPQLNRRHRIVLGEAMDGSEVAVAAHHSSILVTGGSGSGKSTLTGVLIERLIESERCVCVIDPEGDYSPLADIDTVVVMGGGNDKPLPSPDELAQMIGKPNSNLVLNLSALTLSEKTEYVASALGTLERVRAERGRPHWLIIDEAHHVLPTEGSTACDPLSTTIAEGLCLITFDAALLAPQALKLVNTVAARTEKEFAEAVKAVMTARELEVPSTLDNLPEIGSEQAAIVHLDGLTPVTPIYFQPAKRRTTHRRHIRKYAHGELPEDRSFFFRGPEGKLNLRAANLVRFSELAGGVDDETWLYHLQQGDYSQWLREMIKNDDLANEVEEIERRYKDRPAEETRRHILEAINRRYAA